MCCLDLEKVRGHLFPKALQTFFLDMEVSGFWVGPVFKNKIFLPFKIGSYQVKPRLFLPSRHLRPGISFVLLAFLLAGMATNPKWHPLQDVCPSGRGLIYSLTSSLCNVAGSDYKHSSHNKHSRNTAAIHIFARCIRIVRDPKQSNKPRVTHKGK